jgi:hypothetical protein
LPGNTCAQEKKGSGPFFTSGILLATNVGYGLDYRLRGNDSGLFAALREIMFSVVPDKLPGAR